MQTQTMNANDARTRWRDVLDAVMAGGAVVVERHGKKVAAVISFETYAAMAQAIEDYEDERDARLALEAYQRDPTGAVTLEELEAELDDEEATGGAA